MCVGTPGGSLSLATASLLPLDLPLSPRRPPAPDDDWCHYHLCYLGVAGARYRCAALCPHQVGGRWRGTFSTFSKASTPLRWGVGPSTAVASTLDRKSTR